MRIRLGLGSFLFFLLLFSYIFVWNFIAPDASFSAKKMFWDALLTSLPAPQELSTLSREWQGGDSLWGRVQVEIRRENDKVIINIYDEQAFDGSGLRGFEPDPCVMGVYIARKYFPDDRHDITTYMGYESRIPVSECEEWE